MALGGLNNSVCSKSFDLVSHLSKYYIQSSLPVTGNLGRVTYRVRGDLSHCFLSKAIGKCPKQLAVHVRTRLVI